MPEPRPEKSDAILDRVTFSQPPKRSQATPEPTPPIDNLIADTTKKAAPAAEVVKRTRARPSKAPEPPETVPKGKVTVVLPEDLIERLRNAAWWKRTTLAALSEEGIQQVLIKLERENGGPFEPREDELKPGRPQGSRTTSSKTR